MRWRDSNLRSKISPKPSTPLPKPPGSPRADLAKCLAWACAPCQPDDLAMRKRRLHIRRQVVVHDGIPNRQQLQVRRQCRLMIARLNLIPKRDAKFRRRRQYRRDRPMRAEAERRIEQGIHRAHDQTGVSRCHEQVRQQLQIARALLHADEPIDFAQHAIQQRRRAVRPGHYIVDHQADAATPPPAPRNGRTSCHRPGGRDNAPA